MSDPRRIISDPLDDPARRTRQDAAERQRRIGIEHNTVAILDLPDHGAVRKVLQRHSCRCGRRRHFYVADTEGYPLILEPSLCPVCQFDEVVAAQDLTAIEDEYELLDAEFANFQSAWPRIAQVIAPLIEASDPERTLFPLGTRKRPRRVGALIERDWREFLARHGQGDCGEFGRLAEAEVSLTDAQRRAPELFPIGVQNAVAFEAGEGVIRSRYPLPVALAAELGAMFLRQRPNEPPTSLATVDAATRLVPGQAPVTVALLGRRGEHCFFGA